MNVRNLNVPKEDGDKERQEESTEEEDILLPRLGDGDRKTRLNQVPVQSSRGPRSKQMSPPTMPTRIMTKKRFRETYKEESSWLVHSSYSNRELLRGIFGMF